MVDIGESVDKLVDIAGDYENCKFDQNHVRQWLEQFPEQHHEVILSELNFVLEKTYISKKKSNDYINAIVNEDVLPDSLENCKFLNIQIAGRSQSDLLDLLKKSVESSVDLMVTELDNDYEGSFVYIDDVFYTGNRLYRDIENWLKNLPDEEDIKKIENLVIVYYFAHASNLNYRMQQLERILPYTKIEFKIGNVLNNNIKNLSEYDAFLPTDKFKFSTQASKYISSIDDLRSDGQKAYISLIRPDQTYNSSQFIGNQDNRKILEHLFFEEGVQITDQAVNSSIKPMGYDYQASLGFGSMVVTYRNAPNNGPLVFWWGNEQLDNWYPLFPRIVY